MKTTMFRALLFLTIMFNFGCANDFDQVYHIDDFTIKHYDFNEDEKNVMKVVNAYRANQGLNTLGIIEHIGFLAEAHNQYMIEINQIGHYNFEFRNQNLQQVLGAKKVGENIAYNYLTANAVLNAWNNSDGHKKILDGDYTHFGIAVSTHPSNNRKYYTAIFIQLEGEPIFF